MSDGTQGTFTRFVNQMQMASFGSLVGEIRWTVPWPVLFPVVPR